MLPGMATSTVNFKAPTNMHAKGTHNTRNLAFSYRVSSTCMPGMQMLLCLAQALMHLQLMLATPTIFSYPPVTLTPPALSLLQVHKQRSQVQEAVAQQHAQVGLFLTCLASC
jgi:hypothetical protein